MDLVMGAMDLGTVGMVDMVGMDIVNYLMKS